MLLPHDVGALESTPVLEFTAIDAIAADTNFTIHMVAEGRAFFGERRTIALVME